MSIQFQTTTAPTPRLQELRIFRAPVADAPIYAVVTHDPALGLISDFWAGGFADDAGFRAVLEFIVECFETGDYRYWLADLRFMSTGFAASLPWMIEEVVPRVTASGLVREAVVVPERRPGLPPAYDVFGDAFAALERIDDARIRGFTDLTAATRWLLAPAFTEGTSSDGA